MFEIKGKYGTARCYAETIEPEAIGQIMQMMNMPFAEGASVAIMPDAHVGAGCTIGTTMTVDQAICPNLVGVDIGCLDAESEVLTERGWVKMPDWGGEPILVYDEATDTARFETAYARIEADCDGFYHIKSKYGLDMMLSEEHIVPVWMGYGQKARHPKLWTMRELAEHHNSLTKGVAGAVKTTFHIDNEGLDITDTEIRVWTMLAADGRILRPTKPCFPKWNTPDCNIVEFHFRKKRKIERCRRLLADLGSMFQTSVLKDGSTLITTALPKWMRKSLTPFYRASEQELSVLVDEILKWDGTVDESRQHAYFSTTSKDNADLVQFAFASTGTRAGITSADGKPNWATSWQCYVTRNQYVGLTPTPIEFVSTPNAKKYCCITSTGYFVMRRNNRVAITHNCGLYVMNLGQVDIDLAKLDEACYAVPSGFDVWDGRKKRFDLTRLTCHRHLKDTKRIERNIGTLGGGNHYTELDINEDGNKYLVIHSGSRNLGLQVAKFHQDMAISLHEGAGDYLVARDELIARYKREGRRKEIQGALAELQDLRHECDVPKPLAWLYDQWMDDYIADVAVCQEFARLNRETMGEEICRMLGIEPLDAFHTIHNYVDTDEMVLRKGAISAKAGEKVIIPLNMRDGAVIAHGKGNPDWNQSGPHGAGRLMSRSAAKEKLSLEEFEQQMQGIYTTSVGQSTLDEAPGAYKSADDILGPIAEAVDIAETLKPVYNFKAH